MKMHLERSAQNLISGYGVGLIGVDGTDYRGSVMIARGRVIEGWHDGAVAELSMASFAALFDGDGSGEPPEICLLGTGEDHVFPPLALIAELAGRGVALEVMNTRAACRTYSVLVNEERAVAAALLPIGSGPPGRTTGGPTLPPASEPDRG